MDPADANRLKWKCRRGLLELDLILQRYLERHPADRELGDFLDLPDNDLWEIVSGRRNDYDAKFGGIVARLRAV